MLAGWDTMVNPEGRSGALAPSPSLDQPPAYFSRLSPTTHPTKYHGSHCASLNTRQPLAHFRPANGDFLPSPEHCFLHWNIPSPFPVSPCQNATCQTKPQMAIGLFHLMRLLGSRFPWDLSDFLHAPKQQQSSPASKGLWHILCPFCGTCLQL